MTTVCISGVGLIGGSLGMALRKVRRNRKRLYHVVGFGRSRNRLRVAKRRGAIDSFSTSAQDVIPSAEIVVLGAPLSAIPSLIRKIRPHLSNKTVLTDVASVKTPVIKSVRRLLGRRLKVPFVGAHPVAGSEKVGVENASRHLFKNATCVLTSPSIRSAATKVKRMWQNTGATCLSMSAKKHDQLLALTSHLPHLLSFSLYSLLHQQRKFHPKIFSVVGGAYRDMTRISGADGKMWAEILDLNRQAVSRGIQQYQRNLKILSRQKGKNLTKSLKSISQSKRSGR